MKQLKLLFVSIFILGLSHTAQSQCRAFFNLWPSSILAGDTINFYDSSTIASGANYYWSFGDGNNAYSKNPHHVYSTPGVYKVCLTISDSSRRCFDTYCDTLVVTGTGGSTCKAGFTHYVSGNTVYFYNRSSGSGRSYTYDWIYGDGNSARKTNLNTHSHTYSSAGTYLVWLVQTSNSSSCRDSVADTVVIKNTPRCNAKFVSYRDSVDTCKYVFRSTSTGTHSGTMHNWSFGNGSYGSGALTSHRYSSSGWVAVTLTISDSSRTCYSSYTDSIYVRGCRTTGNKCTLSVSGQVFTGRSLASDATVYLIEKRGNNLFAVDTTSVDSMGYYMFSKVCPGTYFVKSALRKGDVNYTDYIPTYYGNKLRWNNASTITVGNSILQGVDIQMVKGTNPGGKGFIGGNVRKGANKKEGEPLEGIQLMVLNEDFEPVAYVYSDVDGKFEFSSLALGKYLLIAEVPGLNTNGHWIELTEGDSKVDDVVVKVNTEDIVTGVTPFTSLNSAEIFPNPSNDYITVSVPSFDGSLSIVDLAGKVVVQTTMQESIRLDISELNPGVYQVLVQGVQNGSVVNGTSMLLKN